MKGTHVKRDGKREFVVGTGEGVCGGEIEVRGVKLIAMT